MLVYIGNKIIDTDVCEVVEDNSSYNSTGYFYGAVKYKAPSGFEFVVDRSQFTNILNPYPLNAPYPILDLKEKPSGLGKCLERIEEIEDEIVSFEEELEEIREKGEELERIEEIEDEIASLQYYLEEIREKGEELEREFDSIIPKNARLIVEVDNINFGASSMSDFNFWSVEIYEYKGYFIKESDCSGVTRAGEINIEELEDILMYGYINFDNVKCLEYFVENREKI
jgi:hypothetical protein